MDERELRTYVTIIHVCAYNEYNSNKGNCVLYSLMTTTTINNHTKKKQRKAVNTCIA